MDMNREIRARRLVAQHLAGSAARPSTAGPVEVLRELLALRARRFWPGVNALAERAGCRPEDVLDEVRAERIVRTRTGWGSPVLVAAEDARWLSATLTSAGAHLADLARARLLDLDAADIETARGVLLAELRERPFADPLHSAEAFALLAEHGVDPDGGRGPHLLTMLSREPEVVCGATRREATYAHVDSLPVAQRELAGDAALAELAARFLRSHGPADAADLAWWAGLSPAVAAHAVDAAEGVVPFSPAQDETTADVACEVTLGGSVTVTGADAACEAAPGFEAGVRRGRWMADWQTEVTSGEIKRALRRTVVLPAVDEYVHGYADTSLVLGEAGRPEAFYGERGVPAAPANAGLPAEIFGQLTVAHGEVVSPAA